MPKGKTEVGTKTKRWDGDFGATLRAVALVRRRLRLQGFCRLGLFWGLEHPKEEWQEGACGAGGAATETPEFLPFDFILGV